MTKAKFLPNYKSFGGKRYGLNLSFKTKADAVSLAKLLRAGGDNVRVTKERGLGGKADTIYVTWLRKGR